MAALVTVKRSNVFAGYGRLRPFYWLYEATGPDGRAFDNRSLVNLRQVLRQRYGRDLEIVETWN